MKSTGITRKFTYIRFFGYQIDYRSDGWLPLSVREGRARPKWHVFKLGRFGCVTFGKLLRLP